MKDGKKFVQTKESAFTPLWWQRHAEKVKDLQNTGDFSVEPSDGLCVEG